MPTVCQLYASVAPFKLIPYVQSLCKIVLQKVFFTTISSRIPTNKWSINDTRYLTTNYRIFSELFLSVQMKWHKTSLRWKEKLAALQNTPHEKLDQGLFQMRLFAENNFLIGVGWVFIGKCNNFPHDSNLGSLKSAYSEYSSQTNITHMYSWLCIILK